MCPIAHKRVKGTSPLIWISVRETDWNNYWKCLSGGEVLYRQPPRQIIISSIDHYHNLIIYKIQETGTFSYGLLRPYYFYFFPVSTVHVITQYYYNVVITIYSIEDDILNMTWSCLFWDFCAFILFSNRNAGSDFFSFLTKPSSSSRGGSNIVNHDMFTLAEKYKSIVGLNMYKLKYM